MSRPMPFVRFRDDERGVTAVEFAFVGPVLIVMLMAFFDLSHSMYVSSVLQGAVQKAARDGTLEGGVTSADALDDLVEAQVYPLVGEGAEFTSERSNFEEFGQIGLPERFVDKTPFNNKYDPGECFDDLNANGAWDANAGRTGQGGARDAVLYTVTVKYQRLFPTQQIFGASANQTLSASTVLRNQPWDDQTRITPCAN